MSKKKVSKIDTIEEQDIRSFDTGDLLDEVLRRGDLDDIQIEGITDMFTDSDLVDYVIKRFNASGLNIHSPKLKLSFIKTLLGVAYDDHIETEIADLRKLGF